MALPGSGQISMSQVNTELGNSSSAEISMGDSDVRDLADQPSGDIGMSDLHGKSAEVCTVVLFYYNTNNPPRAAYNYVPCGSTVRTFVDVTGANGQQGTPHGSHCVSQNYSFQSTMGTLSDTESVCN